MAIRSTQTLLVLFIVLFSTCSKDGKQSTKEVDDQSLVQADQRPEEWLSYGRNYQENRHSPLNQINPTTIDSLGLAWSVNLGTKRGLEATPIVANGMMYFTGTWSDLCRTLCLYQLGQIYR